jgi:hypothetical protein
LLVSIAHFAMLFKFRYDFQTDAGMERFLPPHGGDLLQYFPAAASGRPGEELFKTEMT